MILVQHKEPGTAAAASRIIGRLIPRKPTQLTILTGAVADHTASLHDAEAAAIADASPRRRYEFSTGRWLARQALGQLSLPRAAIPAGSMREPIWPCGVVASLTHSRDICVVAMSRAGTFRGVGIDIEIAEAVDLGLAPSLLCADESRVFDSSELLRLAFSAKEAVFKSLFPRHRELVDYREVAIAIDPGTRTFTAVARSRNLDSLGLEQGLGLYETDAGGALTLFVEPST